MNIDSDATVSDLDIDPQDDIDTDVVLPETTIQRTRMISSYRFARSFVLRNLCLYEHYIVYNFETFCLACYLEKINTASSYFTAEHITNHQSDPSEYFLHMKVCSGCNMSVSFILLIDFCLICN